jgi:hypothetical protein
MRIGSGLLWLAATLAACGTPSGGGSVSCGIAALTGPLVVHEAFAQGHALNQTPPVAPVSLPVRFVAGPARHGTVATDRPAAWSIVTNGIAPDGVHPGYGVLIVDLEGTARGVLVFEGAPVAGAPPLGTVAIGDRTIPLLGIQLDMTAIERPDCPIFPDSSR